jgi:hypothetical protein
MNRIKRVTPAEAAAVWNSIPSPSARRVARTLAQTGRQVHPSTVARWRAQGWRPALRGPHPIEAARKLFDIAARLFTGDPVFEAEVFARQPETGAQLRALNDRGLLGRSARDALLLQILLAQVVCDRGAFLVRARPAETAKLLRALDTATRAASRALCQVRDWPEHQEPGPR